MFTMWRALLVLGSVATTSVYGALPPGCVHLEDHPLDSANPASIFGSNNELTAKSKPTRVGNLRSKAAIPTHHFATNQIKQHTVPVRLFPYEGTLENNGVTYDAYTMDRWTDTKRTDFMDQQSAWKKGEPWSRLLDLGSNMKQMVAGPDGNPMGVFDGNSGVKVGYSNMGEPVMTDFGDLYANFRYGGGGGSMEVPLVRGATLLTHIMHTANPVITPYCLSSVNGKSVNKFHCPMENSARDGGSGYLEGSCHGSTLTIKVHSTKPILDISKLQWAAERKSTWSSGQHGMHTCDHTHCQSLDGGKTVQITISGASGAMSFAVNYIGHYVLPWAWGDHPMEATCSGAGKRDDRQRRGPEDISMTAQCDAHRNLVIHVDVAGNNIPGINKLQYAAEDEAHWKPAPPMHTCQTSTCTRSGSVITIRTKVSASVVNLALNIIGYTTLPHQQWIASPYVVHCPGTQVSSGKTSTNPGHQNTPAPASPAPSHHTNNNHQTVTLAQNTKFLMELDEPGDSVPKQTRKFVVFFSSPVKANVNSGTSSITFEPVHGGKYSGLVQLGYLGAGPRGDNSQSNYLDSYTGRYSYKPSTSYCVNDAQQKVFASFDWNPHGADGHPSNGDLLMVAMPHHSFILQKHFSNHLHSTPYGFKGYKGADWLLEMDAPRASMEPDPSGVNRVKSNSHQKKDVVDAIGRDAKDVNLNAVCAHSDSYNVGKAIGMVARLASISRAFGTHHYTSLDTSIKSCLEKWLRVDDSLETKWKFHYDNVWGGMFLRGTDGDLGFGTDYGFPYYNDHHFHLGYFLYAAAYYVKHNRSWGQAHKDRLYAIARDVGNLSPKDTRFPIARHKDIYTGFSWATGVVPGERQEESASEGINCYHGLSALGDAFNDANLKHSGQVLLAMELLSVREYWQVRQHNRAHFPQAFQKTGVVGQIAENAFYVYTLDWACDPNKFPMRHGCLVGIQIIPLTAVSKFWVDKEWAHSIQQTCEWAIDPQSAPDYKYTDPTDMRQLGVGWKAFCHAGLSPMDAAHQTAAANYLRDKSANNLVGGTGAASTLLFIYAAT
ncbi:uncharacterized protein LOC124110988 [Haliotis rufescens]|uniref:uncharacterized protein LOC124110988 n=1 Tax=Haliotis rufescens TaxID=6454 RepID=UPI00201F2181|nr:uncharacterized protein LOC124110988 [Haliotis rufescens]